MKAFIYQDLGKIGYAQALKLQTEAFEFIILNKQQGNAIKNQLFFCEHEPVVTLGKNGDSSNLLISEELLRQKNISFYSINRGGDITFHGPGQITGYPVFDLETFQMGLRKYIETLEDLIINFLLLYGVKGERMEGATGVWIEPDSNRARKICAIGVKSSRFVTMHGFALNICTDINYFNYIHPCGFTDKSVTTLALETEEKVTFDTCKKQLQDLFSVYFTSASADTI